MKKLYFLFLFISSFSFGQNYNLLPDTCTHCTWLWTMGGTQIYVGGYTLIPTLDTIYQGNTFMKIPGSQPLKGVRQVGNKVVGFISTDTTQEYIIQDWDANLNDTIFNLYDQNGIYDAIFLSEDSILLNDGSYHRFRDLKGFTGSQFTQEWLIRWHEHGLCATVVSNGTSGWGGLLFNNFVQILGSYYDNPAPHTPDPRYNLNSKVPGCSLQGLFNNNSLPENRLGSISIYPNPTNGIFHIESSTEYKSIQIIDLLGNELIQFNGSPETIDLSGFSDGTYFIRGESQNGDKYVSKIVKTN